jgi:uncharacterized protein YndB with AHSA1/START domain
MEIRSDRRYRFTVGPDELWPVLTQVEHYQRWWPWLRGFDGESFAEGDRWTCTVQPPLPYALSFHLELTEVVAGELAVATIRGDIVGSARLEVHAVDGGAEARLTSSLAPSHPVLRAVATFARPMVRFGHDWVLDTGMRQFTARAL